MPSTQTLTNIILSGVDNSTYQPVYRHTDSTYYFGSTPIQDEEVWRVRKLLHILKGEIDRYYEQYLRQLGRVKAGFDRMNTAEVGYRVKDLRQ